MSTLRTAVLDLAAKGLRVFPCKERGKEPTIHDNLNRATCDPNIIAGWWRSRDFNIGLATGEDSGVWVLDVDGEEGEATLRALEIEHGTLPPTIEAITGKGRHLYFRWPSGTEIRNGQLREDVPGLDWRGNGGYVLAPPSIHPSGRVYTWSVDSAEEFADAPDWLLDLVSNKKRANGGEAAALPPEVLRTFIDQAHEGSDRSRSIARLYGYLVRHYVDPWMAVSIAYIFDETRNEPPLNHGEVLRICNDIANKEADRREGRR